MNEAHVHMLVNHVPIIGIIFGLIILIIGVVIKNISVKNTAYGLFIVSAILAAVSMFTGEGAEEVLEHFSTIEREIIHEHEEIAEKFALLSYIIGAASILGIYLNRKKHTKAELIAFFVIIISSVGIFLAQRTGTTGGEIRHVEIRSNANSDSSNKKINDLIDKD